MGDLAPSRGLSPQQGAPALVGPIEDARNLLDLLQVGASHHSQGLERNRPRDDLGQPAEPTVGVMERQRRIPPVMAADARNILRSVW